VTRRTAAPLSAVLLPLLLAGTLTACGGNDENSGADLVSEPATSSAPSAAASPLASPLASPSVAPIEPSSAPAVPDDSQAAQEVQVTVAGGKVSGDTGRVKVKLGSRVRLTVLSDAADEIHVHGYDLTQDVTASQPAQVEFVADQPGIYTVELHDSRLELTRLQVQ
jgi:hypothetical protein